MKILNYYKHCNVEKHYDGSFTIFGTIESITDIRVKQRYYDYTIEEAAKHFRRYLKEEAKKESIFVSQ